MEREEQQRKRTIARSNAEVKKFTKTRKETEKRSNRKLAVSDFNDYDKLTNDSRWKSTRVQRKLEAIQQSSKRRYGKKKKKKKENTESSECARQINDTS